RAERLRPGPRPRRELVVPSPCFSKVSESLGRRTSEVPRLSGRHREFQSSQGHSQCNGKNKRRGGVKDELSR
ncbi:hypothetical protein LEMLEM_LOCUS15649, partial [Lemmus lemmus]